jgi:N-acetylmuramoyl-L-alanine amidase
MPAQPVKITETGRVLVIAIDAGHGGQDPGASGRNGSREKDITLAIARKLKDRIDAEPGMRAFLTRDSDVFVPLRDRIVRASRQKADIFVSVHADAVRDRSIAGSSVYVLSAGRATNEASRMLADRENAADLMGDMSLENKDDVLASVLLDLSQGASMSASNEAADKVLAQLIRVGAVLDKEVKHASLKVLTSPDMPSMLVETAFISNPKEEAKLNDSAHQQRLADAILAGIRTYFYDNPPPGTQVSQRVAQHRDKQEAGAGMTIMAGGLSK